EAAVERLDALEKVPANDLAQSYRLITEARFGLVQSLREHSSDEAARNAMTRCLTAAIDLELRQGPAATAHALLRETETQDPKLVQRIAETRASTDLKARAHERLQALERDLDPTAQSRERTRQLVLAALALTAISSVLLVRGNQPTPLVAFYAA